MRRAISRCIPVLPPTSGRATSKAPPIQSKATSWQGRTWPKPCRALSRAPPVNWPSACMPRSRPETMRAVTGADGSRHRFWSFCKGGGSSLNNDRLCYINVDDNPDPLLELGRLVPLQLAWSLSGKRGPLVQRGEFAPAMSLADNLVRWAPRNGTHRIHQGFIAHLTGDKEKALAAFRRAMELDPSGYKAAMDSALSAPATTAYRKVMDDAAFAAQLPR